MRKSFKFFLFILSFSLLLFTNIYDSNAEVYQGVDYRILDTVIGPEIDNIRYYKVAVNNLTDGDTIVDIYDYMQSNNIQSLEIQAPSTMSFTLYGSTPFPYVFNGIFRMEFYYENNDFRLKLYKLNETSTNDIQLFDYPNNWQYDVNTYILTTIQGYSSLADGGGYDQTDLDNAYNDGLADGQTQGYDLGRTDGLTEGYASGFDDGKTEGLDEGYNDGYDEGFALGESQGYDDGWEVGHGEGYDNGVIDGQADGYIDGYTEGYSVGYDEARGEYGVLVGTTWLGYDDGYSSGLVVGLDEGYAQGYQNGQDAGYDMGYDIGKEVGDGLGYIRGKAQGFEEGEIVGHNAGYIEGSTDSFAAKLSDWIVPAIVIVLFLGGAIVILNRRVGGRND